MKKGLSRKKPPVGGFVSMYVFADIWKHYLHPENPIQAFLLNCTFCWKCEPKLIYLLGGGMWPRNWIPRMEVLCTLSSRADCLVSFTQLLELALSTFCGREFQFYIQPKGLMGL